MSADPDRDPAFDALWREQSTETPPPHVDAAILAAAHLAATSAPRGRERWLGPRAWRWLMPLAAAAVIAVVVVGVKSPPQTIVDDTVQSASDIPAATAEKRITTPAPEAPQATSAPEPPIATPLRKELLATPDKERAHDTPRVAPGAAPKVEQERAQLFAAPPGPPAAAAGSSVPPPPASRPMRDDAVTALTVETQILVIRTLRDHGRHDEASRELARFRAAYPDADARLPVDLREWAKTVR